MDPDGIEQYIREHRPRYTDEAIRKNLIAAGHGPAAIDEAFRRFGPVGQPTPGEATRPSNDQSGLMVFTWTLYILGGIVGLLGVALAASFGSGAGLAVPIFLVAYLGVGFGIILLLRWAVPRFAIKGIWVGMLSLALVPIFGALMFGTCVAAFTVGRG